MAQEISMIFGSGTGDAGSGDRYAPNGERIISADEMLAQIGVSF
jgi:hypothetical protein